MARREGRNLADESSWLYCAVAGLDEDVARCFLATARSGCFMQAARSLNIKPNKLREKLARLAQNCGRALFIHESSTLALSTEGRQLCEHLADKLQPAVLIQPLVRLTVAETLLHDVLGRSLLTFFRQSANVRLELEVLEGPVPASDQDVDILLWLAEPDIQVPNPGFAAGELELMGRLEYLPHVGKRYSRERRIPQTLDDLQDYMLVSQRGYLDVVALQPWNRLVGVRESGITQVNSYDLQRQMIQWGACIGLLPHYLESHDKTLRPLPGLFGDQMVMHAWLAVRAGEEAREEVRCLLGLVRSSFKERLDFS